MTTDVSTEQTQSTPESAIGVWRQQYISQIIDKLEPTGNVLQVGFDSAATTEKLYTSSVQHLTIIEPNAEKLIEAKQWAKQHSNVTLVPGSWQDTLGSLGAFDVVFFNPYGELSTEELTARQSPEEASVVIEKTTSFINELEEQLSSFSVRYTDEDIASFYQEIGCHHPVELPGLFLSLRNYGFISEEQYTKSIETYCQGNAATAAAPSEELSFVNACLEKHARKGSRVGCYVQDTTSRYDVPLFFEQVITNVDLSYEEEKHTISVEGAPFSTAIVMTVTRSA